MSQELSNQLAELARKLGTSVEHLWPILVHKTVMDWFVDIACLGGLTIAFVIPAISSLRKIAGKDWEGADNSGWLPVAQAWICSAFAIIFGIWLVTRVSQMSDIVYPEAATIMHLIGK